MRFIRASKVGTDPFSQLASGKQAIEFDYVTLGMHPFGFNGIEPGTLGGQQERQNPNALACLLDLLVVLANPGANGLALVPGGIIPDQEPVGLALLEQALTAPVQELSGESAHRSSRDKAQPHLVPLRILWGPLLPQNAITGQRFGVGISLLPGLFDEADWVIQVLPSVHARQGKAAPPDLIQEADGPGRLAAGPGNQAVASVFFCRYCGSGLVIQCLARFQLVFKRLRARRTLSSETSQGMIPCSKLTWAASSKVQVLRSWPKSCGLRGSRSLSRSAPCSLKAVRSRWGREDPSCRTTSPEALNEWITLRTVWSSQPSWRAITGARSPRAEASRIWQRRNTKASDERNPAWTFCSSSCVNGRIKMGAFMPCSIPHLLSPLVGMH